MAAPNVLLLVFDTLRPDFLSCYDNPGVQTPTFDKIAENGILFEKAFSAGPSTEISHGALFSGKYPSETGMVGGDMPIPNDITLLAEHLRNHGYTTFGISGPAKIRSELGYNRGFDTYIEPYYDNLKPKPSSDYFRQVLTNRLVRRDLIRTLAKGPDSLTRLKLEYLKQALEENRRPPFFAFINFLTCHTPYDPPRPYKERATAELSRPRWFLLEYLLESLGYEPVSISNSDIRPDRVFRAAGGKGGPYFADSTWLNEEELKILRSWYKASVEYADLQLNWFIEWLNRTDRAENTLLILTSDHGEYLGEHGLLYHGNFLYDEVLKVPLIISGPQVPSNIRRTDLVSLIDVWPTICDSTGIPIPENISGQSVIEGGDQEAVFAEYGKRDISESKFAEYFGDEQRERFSLGMKCIRTQEEKIILYSNGEREIYHMPEERLSEDSSLEKSDLGKLLTDTLGEQFQHVGSKGPEDDRQVRQNLRDLGYID